MIVVAFAGLASRADPPEPPSLDPRSIPKWVNTLTAPPPVYEPTAPGRYEVSMMSFSQQVLPPPLPATPVWGYGGMARDALSGESLGFVRNSPGPTFEAQRGEPIRVRWNNWVEDAHMFPVDPTLHWADPNGMGTPDPPYEPFPPGYPEAQTNVPLVTHLHGGEVDSDYDGGPDAWFTNAGDHGPAYRTAEETAPWSTVYEYPNAQPAATLWYHDHALGMTRLNVMSGLAGFYLLRDPDDAVALRLPQGPYEMPLVFQDRTFHADGTMVYDTEGLDPSVHPYWTPEFFGDTIMVNGKVWPKMVVNQGWYRFRLLDGSNARFYSMTLKPLTGPGHVLPFYQIGSDGGYLMEPASLTELTLAPGERADILVDFSALPEGSRILLSNNAKSPYPKGEPVDPRTVGQLLLFEVSSNPGFMSGQDLIGDLPSPLNPTLTGDFPNLPEPDRTRTLTLWEVIGPAGPEEILLNGQRWDGVISETPVLGTTEDWVIVNPTADTHPIHLHLVQFQLVSRQFFNGPKYSEDWLELQRSEGELGEDAAPPWTTDYVPVELPVEPYLRGQPRPAPANERGWKDTIQAHPGEVLVFRARWAPSGGSEDFPFDATEGPGYVWHCHILEHEDNEMMRPYQVREDEEEDP